MLDIFPGRSLAFSPQWHEEGALVLFDRNSGDYWVISPLAGEVVSRVVATGRGDTDSIIEHIEGDMTDGKLADTSAAVVSVIRELVQREILIDR